MGVVETVDAAGPSTLFSSFRPSVLARLRAQDADARLALLVSPRDREYTLEATIERAVELGAEAINPHLVQADERLVSRVHEAGLAVNVYTVDPPEQMRRMLDLGVDGVFTNLPDRLRGILREAGGRGS